ncbi:MAG: hypothetical protein R3Y55_05865 [Rikenellaceae bacterium]
MGDAASDVGVSLITSAEPGDYTQSKSSNCYILNPEDSEKTYYIPIRGRINTYWNIYAGEGDKIGVDDPDSWNFEILWYDNGSNPYAKSVDDIGETTFTIEKDVTANSAKTPSLAITLGEDFKNYGNVLVAVKDTSGNILWSWHLWTTEYPYDHVLRDLGVGSYTLKNGTGALHRYEDGSSYTVWGTGGIYEDKYIMDRNIGARDAYTESKDGILYYQFGRKDPFPYTNNAHTLGGTTFTYSTTTSTISNVTMSKAVQNPTTHYYGATSSCWCSDYNSASYV